MQQHHHHRLPQFRTGGRHVRRRHEAVNDIDRRVRLLFFSSLFPPSSQNLLQMKLSIKSPPEQSANRGADKKKEKRGRKNTHTRYTLLGLVISSVRPNVHSYSGSILRIAISLGGWRRKEDAKPRDIYRGAPLSFRQRTKREKGGHEAGK